MTETPPADGAPPYQQPTGRLSDARRRDDNVVAVVGGKVVSEPPRDLYIPPDALEVFLDAFEGPMDLLLYLTRRQNIDIEQIRVAEITDQYMQYVELMQTLKLELAGEYLLMAATLAQIKSRLLLRQPAGEDEEADDPRAELIRRLQDYERVKLAAERLDELPRLERDLHTVHAAKPELVRRHAEPSVDLKEVLLALGDVLRRAEFKQHHAVEFEGLSVRERMSRVLARVGADTGFVPFDALFDPSEGREGVVVTFLALMELVREGLIDLVQSRPFAPIHVCAPRAQADEPNAD
ncbi:MAG: segregation/condensation protein A [Pseudomonadales bacterium]|nr:segregation/condensation protein A [Pseudomonadales bacterium]